MQTVIIWWPDHGRPIHICSTWPPAPLPCHPAAPHLLTYCARHQGKYRPASLQNIFNPLQVWGSDSARQQQNKPLHSRPPPGGANTQWVVIWHICSRTKLWLDLFLTFPVTDWSGSLGICEVSVDMELMEWGVLAGYSLPRDHSLIDIYQAVIGGPSWGKILLLGLFLEIGLKVIYHWTYI